MRKVLTTLLLAGALLMAITSIASGKPVRCTHKPYCTHPKIVVRSLPPACRKLGSTFTLPKITFEALPNPPGVRKVVIKLGSKIIFSKSFKAPGPLKYVLRHLKVHTAGLSKGGHTITIFVRDNVGRTHTRTLRFTVCKPPPFTG